VSRRRAHGAHAALIHRTPWTADPEPVPPPESAADLTLPARLYAVADGRSLLVSPAGMREIPPRDAAPPVLRAGVRAVWEPWSMVPPGARLLGRYRGTRTGTL
jgi:hypothetical protein